jgi:TM2 domain-containing membrane protein YozV
MLLYRKEGRKMVSYNRTQYLRGLTPEQQAMFLAETGRLYKSETTAFLLTFFLGGIGAHRFYLRQKDLGILYVVFCWTLIPAVAALCELFVISLRVRQYNEHVNREVATTLHKYAAPRAGVAAPAAQRPIQRWAYYLESGNSGTPKAGLSRAGYVRRDIYSPLGAQRTSTRYAASAAA